MTCLPDCETGVRVFNGGNAAIRVDLGEVFTFGVGDDFVLEWNIELHEESVDLP